jgi:hypothetical protein
LPTHSALLQAVNCLLKKQKSHSTVLILVHVFWKVVDDFHFHSRLFQAFAGGSLGRHFTWFHFAARKFAKTGQRDSLRPEPDQELPLVFHNRDGNQRGFVTHTAVHFAASNIRPGDPMAL